MRIYTRTGDKGQTMLFTGRCVQKDSPYMGALGDVDECSSCIGMALSHLPDDPKLEGIRKQLIDIQHSLFDLGAAVATPRTEASDAKRDSTRFDEKATQTLEEWIDSMSSELPKLKNFILPGGHPAGAQLHLARSVCRRAERSLIVLLEGSDIEEHVLVFMNRLSDYLFTAARYVNNAVGVPETEWQKEHGV